MFGPPFSPSDPLGVPHIAAASSSARRVKSLFPAALFPFCAGVPAIGVGHIVAAAAVGFCPEPRAVTSCACGVVHCFATVDRPSPLVADAPFLLCRPASVVAVGHDEHALPFMRRACFSRREEASRRREAQASKVSENGVKAEGNVTGDILEKAPAQSVAKLVDDPGNVGPEVARIVFPSALPGLAERLAWVSGEQGVELPAPRASAEPLEVIPDRCRVKISGCLSCDEALPGIFLDLDKGGGGKARLGKAKAHVKAAAARAEGESVSGR